MVRFMMRKKSYAKITLFLYAYKEGDILKFRNVIVPIDLFDMVYLEKNDVMEISTNKKYLPNDKRNTVYLALDLLKKQYGITDNFKVHIVKNIPAQSGLGGGSSNAATIINMFDEMYDLKMSLEEKNDIAMQIDEDTPYCVLSKPAMVEGIGEIVTPFDLEMDLYYIVVKPGFGVSTKSFLRKFNDVDLAYASHMELMKDALLNQDYDEMISLRYNGFQNTVTKRYNAMSHVIDRLESMELDGVGMSGSGSVVFGLSTSKEKVMAIYEKIALEYPFVKYGRVLK